eukprot:960403-Pleurochrysis_carterae.AAC.2
MSTETATHPPKRTQMEYSLPRARARARGKQHQPEFCWQAAMAEDVRNVMRVINLTAAQARARRPAQSRRRMCF